MTKKWECGARLFLAFAIGLNVITMWIAIGFDRPLYNDGAFWVSQILSTRSPFIDQSYYRYFKIIWQLPSWMVLKLSPAGSDVTALVTNLFSICNELHPLVSLIGCFWILKSKGKIAFFLFPLLSFALATQSTMGFSTGEVPDALSVFWPLFLLTLFRTKDSSRETVLIGILSALLTTTYQLGVLLFAFLMFITVFRRLKFDDRSTQNKICFAIFAAGGLILTWMVLGPHPVPYGYFSLSLHRLRMTDYRLFTLGCLLGWSGFVLGALRPIALLILTVVLAALTLSWHLQHPLIAGKIVEAYHSRTIALPLALWIALLVVIQVGRRRIYDNHDDRARSPVLSAVCACCLIVSSAHDLATTYAWTTSVRRIQAAWAQTSSPCVIDDRASQDLAFEEQPFVSTLAIIIQKTKRPSRAYFERWRGFQIPAAQFCADLTLGKIDEANIVAPLSGRLGDRPYVSYQNQAQGYFDWSAFLATK